MQTAYLADEGAMSKDVGDFGTVDYVDTDATETAVPAQGEVVQEPEKPAESKPSTNKAAEALFKG